LNSGDRKMTYSKLEYYENGNLKSIEVSGIFVDFKFKLNADGKPAKR